MCPALLFIVFTSQNSVYRIVFIWKLVEYFVLKNIDMSHPGSRDYSLGILVSAGHLVILPNSKYGFLFQLAPCNEIRTWRFRNFHLRGCQADDNSQCKYRKNFVASFEVSIFAFVISVINFYHYNLIIILVKLFFNLDLVLDSSRFGSKWWTSLHKLIYQISGVMKRQFIFLSIIGRFLMLLCHRRKS